MNPAAGALIVGGGLAAQRCAETLRRRGYDRPVRMVGAEEVRPYDRPPLSKQVLAGELAAEALSFRPPDWYRENEIELVLGRPACGLDPASRRLRLANGEELLYEELVIATGAEARALPFLGGFENVHTLRTAADAIRLAPKLAAGARVAIVGAGFIGQEVAATARGHGCDVAVIEALPAPLLPVLGSELGAWFGRLHEEEGVRVLLGTAIAAAHGGRTAEELELADGRRVGCDHVVVGIGTVPAVGWLAESGLDPSGVRTDTSGRTPIPGIYAAGDACIPFEPRYGTHERTEHWDAAAWQGAAVGKAITGQYPGTPPLPSFWSDQYGHRIQYVGHARRADGMLVDGDPDGRDFEVLFTRGGIPVGGLTVDRPRSIPALRKQIESGRLQPPVEEATL